MIHEIDTLILGAGAAGMMAAAHTGGRVLVIDHAKAAGEKIRISGGGRCNFTNLHCRAETFLSENPHFAKSALSRYGPQDFLALVNAHGIGWHEKTLGQLFCDHSAKEIVAMLRREMARAGADLWLETQIDTVAHRDGGFVVTVTRGGRATELRAQNLILATGGKSIPKMGATGLAYRIAADFGHRITPTRPALVPFTFDEDQRAEFAALAGVALDVRARADGPDFNEAMLFTHRGLSGPAILQISSYWVEGGEIVIDLLGGDDLRSALRAARQRGGGGRQLATHLTPALPRAVIGYLTPRLGLDRRLGDCSDRILDEVIAALRAWHLRPTATEGYRTAEVTLGGIATDGIDARRMESRHVPRLYMIGEAVDVTGWLGGYNFQWAWASAMAAARAIAGD